MVRRGSSMLSVATNQPAPPGRSFSIGTTTSSIQRKASRTLRPARSQTGPGIAPLASSPHSDRIFSTSSNRTRVRSGSVATSHYSQYHIDPLHHVEVGPSMPVTVPNMDIILPSKTMMNESPHDELAPPTPSAAMGQASLGIGSRRPRTASNTPRPNSQHGPPSANRLSGFGRPRGNSTSRASVTTREAVVGEVLAEEQLATAERVKQESDEVEQERKPRKWWSSWLYQRSHHED